MRAVKRVLFVLTWLVILPVSAFAQASITGVVQDASGAVLPGVTVEASSPVLIEKVRSAVTDGSGQYRIVDLRPGVYTVTFALTGFSTVKREGIELRGSFTASVNADMSVGSLAETITVSGESPIVDVQNTNAQRALTKDVLDSIPAGRSHLTQAVLIPGLTTTQGAARGNLMDVGGTRNLQNTLISIHGGRDGDTRVMIDGVRIGNMSGSGQWHNFVPDQGSTQEVVIDYGAVSAENISGGLKINHVPREGGNTFKGSIYATAVNENWQASNITDELRASGLGAPNALKRMYDINPSGGGPIKRDKLWFYASARFQENKNYVAGIYTNLNAGDPTKWAYAPDLNDQGVFSLNQDSANGRVTWQAAEKHKITGFYDQQRRPWNDLRPGATLEAVSWWRFPRLRTMQAGWTSPITSKLLFEGRWSNRGENYDDIFQNTTPPRDLIAVLEQGGSIPGLVYRGHAGAGSSTAPFGSVYVPNLNTVLFNVSYVTGSHAVKFGVQDTFGYSLNTTRDIPEAVAYRFNNGVPNQIQMRATPYYSQTNMRAEYGMYVQDKWTIDRLTLTGGLRFDWLSYYYPSVTVGPGPLAPTRNFTTDLKESVNWKDITPRVGVAYDLFGNGKTALKGSFGRYVINADSGNATAPANPITGLALTTIRSWTDANSNYNPDCDLLNLQSQDFRGSGGDFCGTVDNLNFGGRVPTRSDDPATYNGWGTRAYNWEFSGSVQHEVVPRVSVEVGYFRRIFGNFTIQDNLATAASDYTQYSITAPLDPRLPGGGGYTVSGLYDLNPNKVGQQNNLVTFSDNYGRYIEHWNGVDFTVNARPSNGVVLQGGVSTGRTSLDTCDVRAKVPELSITSGWSAFPVLGPTYPYCKVDTNFLTQIKLLGTYTVPKVDLLVGATYQSLPGPQLGALYVADNSVVQPSLGRSLSGGVANTTINLLESGQYFVPRANLFDVRLGKLFHFGARRVSLNLDIHNMFNRSPVLLLNNNYVGTGSTWQTPQAIMEARLFKLSTNIDF
jgi:carboxypeptidase family protein